MLSPASQTLLVILTYTFLMMIKVARTYGEDWTNFEGTFGYGQPVDWCEDNQNLKILLIFKDTKMMFDRFFSVYDSPVHIEYQNPPVSVFIWDPIIVSRIKITPSNKQITFDRTKKTCLSD